MYSVKKIENKQEWDSFVDARSPSTFLHEWAWGETEKMMSKKIFRFGVYDDAGKLSAVLLSVLVEARRGKFLLCPHGPVIGKGILNNGEEGGDMQVAEILGAFTRELKTLAKSLKCDFIRVCPILIDTDSNRKIFKKIGFRGAPIHVYSELSWILDISPGEEQLLSGMKKNTRYGVRKAERDGITVTSSGNEADIETFWNVYSETAARQHFVPYSKKYIATEFAAFAAEGRALWYTAFYNNKPVSTALIIFGKDSAFYHHGASLPVENGITPSELLQWQIIKDAKNRGCTHYNFWGVVPEEKSKHPWAGLSRFKRGFGGYSEKYVHAQDLPLSWKYGITYFIETIRRWKRKV